MLTWRSHLLLWHVKHVHHVESSNMLHVTHVMSCYSLFSCLSHKEEHGTVNTTIFKSAILLGDLILNNKRLFCSLNPIQTMSALSQFLHLRQSRFKSSPLDYFPNLFKETRSPTPVLTRSPPGEWIQNDKKDEDEEMSGYLVHVSSSACVGLSASHWVYSRLELKMKMSWTRVAFQWPMAHAHYFDGHFSKRSKKFTPVTYKYFLLNM